MLAIFRALWAGEANLAEPATLAALLDEALLDEALLDEAGLDGAGVIERSATPEYHRKLESATREAAERGVFGSPTFFVGDQMFFGNDRLDFVAATLQQAA